MTTHEHPFVAFERRLSGLERRVAADTDEKSDLHASLGGVATELSKLRASLGTGFAQVHTRIDATHERLEALGRALDIDVRPKLESLSSEADRQASEITGVGERANEMGRAAHEARKLIARARRAERWRRHIMTAVLVGFAGTVGAGIAALAFRSCALNVNPQVEVHP